MSQNQITLLKKTKIVYTDPTMDHKDFIKLIKFRDAEAKKQAQATFAARNRNSRPRAKNNLIAPHLRNI